MPGIRRTELKAKMAESGTPEIFLVHPEEAGSEVRMEQFAFANVSG